MASSRETRSSILISHFTLPYNLLFVARSHFAFVRCSAKAFHIPPMFAPMFFFLSPFFFYPSFPLWSCFALDPLAASIVYFLYLFSTPPSPPLIHRFFPLPPPPSPPDHFFSFTRAGGCVVVFYFSFHLSSSLVLATHIIADGTSTTSSLSSCVLLCSRHYCYHCDCYY